MNKEKQERLLDLLKDIDELCNENRNLKRINYFLYNAIKYIKEQASEICSIVERKGMVDTCNSALIYADKLAQKLGVKIDE
jgi:hypothetical protein